MGGHGTGHHDEEEEEHVIKLADPNIGVNYSWNYLLRNQMRTFFETKVFHIIVVVLVLIDLVIVMFDLIVALAHCGEEHPNHTLEEVAHVFHYVSIGILCVFVVENLLQLYAFGLKFFTKSILHVVDFVVIVVSLILDITITDDSLGEVSSLLVIVRLWRLARIIHATEHITAFEKESEHDNINQKLERLQQQLETERQKVRQLQRLLGEHRKKEREIQDQEDKNKEKDKKKCSSMEISSDKSFS
eukprot:TRINITY_DN3871_c3_g1_i1.p1 TRINITY_DN3871_c3_g1~~TRINITY_DN3871_c3_g1_i1.p1  ORF type:complete len:245 (-),score=27.89 TRINITY_DN3871_c3_g1_i1:310-1044(-)